MHVTGKEMGDAAGLDTVNWQLSLQLLNGSLGNDPALKGLMLQALPAEPALADTDQEGIPDTLQNPCGTNPFVNDFFLVDSDGDGNDVYLKTRLATDTQNLDTGGYGVLGLNEILTGINQRAILPHRLPDLVV